MTEIFRGDLFERDALPVALTQFSRQSLKLNSWSSLIRERPPARGGAVGAWAALPGDPLAELLIVRNEDFLDTFAWLNSFFSGLSPVTQWCRVITYSQAELIAQRETAITLGRLLGAWVGAVLAECSVQAGGVQNLRDVPGSAAASTASFAAGRAVAVWGGDCNFIEIARRHDELSQSLREGSRPLLADSLVPLWSVLNGRNDKSTYSMNNVMEPLSVILSAVASQVDQVEPDELIKIMALQARDYFDLPELIECARGPQVERVRALDRLGERLVAGPRSPSIDALLGLGASFIDPGAAVAPELLRRYSRQLPVAPIWQGAFAGAMAPLRVMTDQGGLGRLVAKALLEADDLKTRPSCDIAYDELVRWITPGRSLKLDVRGMSARALSVELVTGVTCMFPYGRSDASSAAPQSSTSRVEVSRSQVDRSRGSGRSLSELDTVVLNLQQRLERLETHGIQTQQSLEFPEPKGGKSPKGGRYSSSKKSSD